LNDHVCQDTSGGRHILGEVLNNTGSNQENVAIRVTLLDEAGSQVGETLSFSPFSSIPLVPAGHKAPFAGELPDGIEFHGYELEISGSPTEVSLRDDLEIVSHSQSVDDRGYVVSGEAQNPGAPVMLAEVVAAAYDAEGRVVGLGSHVFNPGALGQGQTAAFEIVVEARCGEAADYGLQVQGL
jgi:hypothetical protein